MAGAPRAGRFVGLIAVGVLGLVLGTQSLAGAADPPWRIVPSPNRGLGPLPGDVINNTLLDVSCVNNTRCVAVGYDSHTPDSGAARERSVVQTLVAGSWKLRPIRQRGGDPFRLQNRLVSVSCVTGLRCVAVGHYYDPGLQYAQTLIATYIQDRWTLIPSPNRPGFANLLTGIDCTDATHCVAVGATRDDIGGTGVERTLVLTLQDGTWSITASPNRGSANELRAVSCGDATHCVAVGRFSSSTANGTLILARDGDTWQVKASRNVSGTNNQLDDVSCPTVTTCVAVGSTDDTLSDVHTLAQILSGGHWNLTATPDRPGYENRLRAVSCVSESRCIAAGQSRTAGGTSLTLIETLAGGSWGLTPSPSKAGTYNDLNGVSCPNATHCVAAGLYGKLDAPSRVRDRTLILTNSP